MLLIITIVKAVVEIALMALLGRFILGWLAGERRESNLIYQVLSVLVRPVLGLARLLSPRVVLDRHVPLVAFLLLGFAWVFALAAKVDACLRVGVDLCR
ncbi:MAG TPA: YggT family protein [Hydrogenophaga sp.]|uniref:hypothetical protein n=1 Tax=Hydrogenophaga sp. TaxID=1904254 RepID=UPI002B5C67C0|nr:hypothetical protein [Hydrogenophaga sp.]HMN91626.1 YggT family protein [Hydrogenophaga sp.]HMP10002.1 YggT family protein [Hydrogenophaga sp.]